MASMCQVPFFCTYWVPFPLHDGYEVVTWQVPFFSTVPDRNLRDLADLLELRLLQQGEYVFHQGDVARQMSILVDGRVRITHSTREAGVRS